MDKKRILLIALSFLANILAIVFLLLKTFYPYHVLVSFGIYSLGWVPFLYALLHGKNRFIAIVKKHRFLIVLSVVSLVILWIIFSLFPISKFEILLSDKIELENKINSDLIYAEKYIEKLKESENILIDELDGVDFAALSPQKKESILEKWRNYLSYVMVLETLTEDYKYFYQIDYIKYKSINEKGFILNIIYLIKIFIIFC